MAAKTAVAVFVSDGRSLQMKTDLRELTRFSLFAAIIVLLAVTPLGYISLGVINATTIQIPVILGAILFGWKKGAALGLIFGVTSMLKNTFQPNATSFVFSPFIPVLGEESGSLFAVLISLLPRVMIGVVAGLLFVLLSKTKLSRAVSCGICGFCGSMTNTMLVMGGIYLFFGESYSAARDIAYETLLHTVAVTITGAGITEAVVSAVIGAAVCVPLFKFMKKRMSIPQNFIKKVLPENRAKLFSFA